MAVDMMDVVQTLSRGAIGAVGLRASETVGNLVSDGEGASASGAFSNIAVGAGIDLGSEFFTEDMRGEQARWLNLGGEAFGTGVQIAGWDEASEVVGLGSSSGQQVIEVTDQSSDSKDRVQAPGVNSF